MSKETLNAEELENYKKNIIDILDDFSFGSHNIEQTCDRITLETEAYHKAKVNAITDEEIKKYINLLCEKGSQKEICEVFIDWFKNRLLNG